MVRSAGSHSVAPVAAFHPEMLDVRVERLGDLQPVQRQQARQCVVSATGKAGPERKVLKSTTGGPSRNGPENRVRGEAALGGTCVVQAPILEVPFSDGPERGRAA